MLLTVLSLAGAPSSLGGRFFLPAQECLQGGGLKGGGGGMEVGRGCPGIGKMLQPRRTPAVQVHALSEAGFSCQAAFWAQFC